MTQVILAIHLLLALGLIGVILIQRSEGGGLGIGGSGGGGGFMTSRGTANLLTRITGGLAAAFMCTSLSLAVIANQARVPSGSLLDAPAPVVDPATPVAPAVPLSK
jgi:preprotein translocase subunit SecG